MTEDEMKVYSGKTLHKLNTVMVVMEDDAKDNGNPMVYTAAVTDYDANDDVILK